VCRARNARDQQPTEHPIPAQHAEEGVNAAADGDAVLPGRIGKGQVLDDPDQVVAAVHGQVDPGGGKYCSRRSFCSAPTGWSVCMYLNSRLLKKNAERKAAAEHRVDLAKPEDSALD
jgi:hypothetical protein